MGHRHAGLQRFTGRPMPFGHEPVHTPATLLRTAAQVALLCSWARLAGPEGFEPLHNLQRCCCKRSLDIGALGAKIILGVSFAALDRMAATHHACVASASSCSTRKAGVAKSVS